MTVTLENRSPRRKILHLTHDHACSDTSCTCARVVVGVQDHHPVTGAKTLRALRRRLPGSITLLARGHEGARISGLPESLLADPEVAKAIRAKQIAWTADDDTKKIAAHHPHAAGKLAAQRAAQASAEAHEAALDADAERTARAETHAAEQEALAPRLLKPGEDDPKPGGGGGDPGSKKAEG